MFSMQSDLLYRSRSIMALVFLALILAALGCKTVAPVAPPAPTQASTRPAEGSSQGETEVRSQPLELPSPGDPAHALLPAASQDISMLENPSRYTIALNIDPSLQSFQGRLRVKYTNQEDVALNEVYFRLLPNGHKSYGNGSLTVSEVLLNGEGISTELSLQDTVLKLELPESLPPGESVEVEMVFEGEVPLDFGGEAEPAGYGIYNLGQDVLALSGWYPILAVYDEQGWNLDPVSAIGDSVYSDTALYSVRVCAPADLVVAATGNLIDEQVSDGTTCAQLESGPTRDFFLVASSNFQRDSQQVDGVTLNSYSLPGHESASRQALEIATDSLSIFNQKFGPYPFTELDMVDAPMRNALGVEYPGVFLVGNTLYDEPDDPSFAITVAHEVAHQWWYSVVGNDVFDSPWLDEGLTTYSSILYYEFYRPPDYARGLIDYWQQRYDQLKTDGKDEQITASLEYFEELGAPSIYGTVVYTKAALFFRALRQEIGDEAFFVALQRYYQDQKYGIAVPVDLLNAFEEAAGRSLEAFYNEWLYTPEK
jgi:hypothetical protein